MKWNVKLMLHISVETDKDSSRGLSARKKYRWHLKTLRYLSLSNQLLHWWEKNEQFFLDWEDKIISFLKSLWKKRIRKKKTHNSKAYENMSFPTNLKWHRKLGKKEAVFTTPLTGSESSCRVIGGVSESSVTNKRKSSSEEWLCQQNLHLRPSNILT